MSQLYETNSVEFELNVRSRSSPFSRIAQKHLFSPNFCVFRVFLCAMKGNVAKNTRKRSDSNSRSLHLERTPCFLVRCLKVDMLDSEYIVDISAGYFHAMTVNRGSLVHLGNE